MIFDEFNRLLSIAGCEVYRRYGRILVAFPQGLKSEKFLTIIKSVKVMSTNYAVHWKFPSPDQLAKWQASNYMHRYVCDDPCPKDVDEFMTVQRIREIARSYSFDFGLVNGVVRGKAFAGHDIEEIKKNLPKWFIDLTKTRIHDINAELTQGV